MNVVDSSGWIENVIDGPNADFFVLPIEDEASLATPTICIYDVFKRVLSELGEERALDVVGILSRGTIVELNRQDAMEASRLSYHMELSMADSISLAMARAYDAMLWTQDAHSKILKACGISRKYPDHSIRLAWLGLSRQPGV